MVSFEDIILNNESLSSAGSGPIAALAGCTNGIGLATLHALLKHTTKPVLYLIGRDSSRLSSIVSEASKLNASAALIPIVADDLTLVSSAQRAAEEILSHKPPRLDLLIVSQGYLSLSSQPDFSPEGLDRITSIRYHARMRMVVTLLPLLRKSPSPRVISVLASGREGNLDLDDLSMTKTTPGKPYSVFYAVGAASAMTTLFLEHLATLPGNDRMVFIHIFPGPVADTGLHIRDGSFIIRLLYDWVLKPVMRVIGSSASEAGERVLFAATNGRFRRVEPAQRERMKGTLIQEGTDGVQGSGVYAVQADSSVVTGGGNKELKRLREMGAARKVWEYTMGEFERIETMNTQ
ncbi:uncharacterized protein Z518_06698 [Rhinocladiella mackenziei CBS 650.93]|uniref:NAD(P)-binding protein n=1 Tax=Rhinocladiella mackenziei CBS 650.93 TaxID=1442369 RepID=A0A0D2FMD9_9EURO|nr:uncharacterized protein Z518_06698 [Rhinocladiella mackenziei CBS 650.93]KIX03147.1 hypothetical protein Z518_06698 [Rhinocladiella mackenziei CBS 650.93]